MTTATMTKVYEVTMEPKTVPADVMEAITNKVTADFDRYTEICPAEYLADRIANRDAKIASKIKEAASMWQYDNLTTYTFNAENKSAANTKGRQLAKEFGLQFRYVYYCPMVKEA